LTIRCNLSFKGRDLGAHHEVLGLENPVDRLTHGVAYRRILRLQID
jgi:hypothetical protein